MAEHRTDKFKEVEEEEERPKGGRLRRFFLFLLTLVVVLAVVVLAAWRDGTGFDAVRRWLNYGVTPQVENSAPYRYDADRGNRFAALGKSVLVVSETSLRLLDEKGAGVYAVTAKMNAPALSQGGGLVAVVDVGGSSLRVLGEKGLAYELSADEQEPFIAATMNQNGYLAVTAQKKGYKGVVSVYPPDYATGGEPRFVFRSADRFVVDACVDADNKALSIVTVGQENGTFSSRILRYPLDSDQASGSYDISDGLVLAVSNFGDGLAAVSDTYLSFASSQGELTASYDYGGAYLRDYDLAGDGYAALLLNQYKSGSAGRLVTVDSEGQELGSLRVEEEILNLSAAGRYLAVLYSDELVVYTPDLLEYGRLEEISTAREVVMQADGSVLVFGSEQAGRYLP